MGVLRMSVSNIMSVVEVVTKYMGEQHSIKDAKIVFFLMDLPEYISSYRNIIKTLNMSPVTVTRGIKFLLDAGVVTFTIDDNDTRQKYVALSDRGKAFKLELTEAFEKAIKVHNTL